MADVRAQKSGSALILEGLERLDAKLEAQAIEVHRIGEDLNYGATVKSLATTSKTISDAIVRIAAQPLVKATPAELQTAFETAASKAMNTKLDQLTKAASVIEAAVETRFGSAVHRKRILGAAAGGLAIGVMVVALLARSTTLGPLLIGAQTVPAVNVLAATVTIAPTPAAPAHAAKNSTADEEWTTGGKMMADAAPDAWAEIVWRSKFHKADLVTLENCLIYRGIFGDRPRCEFGPAPANHK